MRNDQKCPLVGTGLTLSDMCSLGDTLRTRFLISSLLFATAIWYVLVSGEAKSPFMPTLSIVQVKSVAAKVFPEYVITLPLETTGSVINVQIAHDAAETVLRLRFPSPSKETGSEIGAIVCQVMNEHGNFTFAGSYASRRTNTGRRDGNDHRNQIL